MTTFAIAALLLIMVPGPDQALITRNSLVGGRYGGALTVVGGVLGVAVHACAAAVGLSALLMASATAFTALKIVGTAYLVWLAVQMLRSARRARRSARAEDVAEQVAGRSPRPVAYLRQGFLSNALNPKVALFFVTFLPQFLPAGSGSPRADALVHSAVFAVLYLAWFGSYVAVVHQLGRWLRRAQVKARIEQVTGTLLLAVAVRLATTSH
jgi:threonine/homoserine/homoserine lactone efflux protein